MHHFITPGTIYSSSSPRFTCCLPDSQHDDTWLANIKACEPGGTCRAFTHMMFVEPCETVPVWLGHEDGLQIDLKPDLADTQYFG